MMCLGCHLVNVVNDDPDLVISHSEVQFGKYSGTMKLIQ